MSRQESRTLVRDAYTATKNLLVENRSLLQKLSDELFKRETLDYDDVAAIIGPPPHGEKRQVQTMPTAPMAPETSADADDKS